MDLIASYLLQENNWNLQPGTEGRHDVVTCYVCGKNFSGPNRQYVLSRHLTTTHSSHKPYMCLHCDYRAARRDHVTRHSKVIHGIKDQPNMINTLQTSTSNFNDLI